MLTWCLLCWANATQFNKSFRIALNVIRRASNAELWQRSHTVSSTPCHGAWTSAPLSVHLSMECKCTAAQIETPICTRCIRSHEFIWQQQDTCDAVGRSPMECGVGRQPQKTPHFHLWHRHLPPEWPSQEESGSSLTASARCWTFPLLLVQMEYGLLCGLWVWRRRTNCQPCCPPMSNPSTSLWTTWPDGSGRWDNRMAAQHLPRDLVRPSSGLNN